MVSFQRVGLYKMKGVAAPLWLWVFAIISVGSFVLLVNYLDRYQTMAESGNDPILDLKRDAVKIVLAKPAKTLSGKNDNDNKNDSKTEFDFYKLLPELESVIPDIVSPGSKASKKRTDEAKIKPSSDPVPAIKKPGIKKPENTTIVSQPVTKVPSVKAASKQTTLGVQYYLQAGSFKEYQAADRLKANLAFIGIKSKIHKVTLGKTGIWHRVRMGPFKNMGEMRRVKGRLQASKIESIMLKVKG